MSGDMTTIALGQCLMAELERGPMSAADLAKALAMDGRQVELLLGELAGTGWIVQSGDQYMLVEQPVR